MGCYIKSRAISVSGFSQPLLSSSVWIKHEYSFIRLRRCWHREGKMSRGLILYRSLSVSQTLSLASLLTSNTSRTAVNLRSIINDSFNIYEYFKIPIKLLCICLALHLSGFFCACIFSQRDKTVTITILFHPLRCLMRDVFCL